MSDPHDTTAAVGDVVTATINPGLLGKGQVPLTGLTRSRLHRITSEPQPLSSAGYENNLIFVAVHGAAVDGRVVAMVGVDSRWRKAVSAAGTSLAFQWASKTSSSLASPCSASIVVRSNSSDLNADCAGPLHSASDIATAATVLDSWSSGTTACSHPVSASRRAGTSCPVSASQRAMASPTFRGSRTLDPPAGNRLFRICPSPIRVDSAATATSHASASSRPPATAWP